VTLIDENARPGGQYFKQPPAAVDPLRLPAALAENYEHGRELLDGLAHARIRLLCNTLVWNITPDRALDLYGPEGPQHLQPRKLILASGAYERVVPFDGWSLPGITTVGAAQVLLKGSGLVVGRRILVAGTGPLLQVAAVQLLEAGAEVVAILELRSRTEFLATASRLFGQWARIGQGMAHQKRLMEARVPIKYGYGLVSARGDKQVEEVLIARVDENGLPVPRSEERLAVDSVCINYGFVPATELARLAGCDQYFDRHFDCFATRTNEEFETSRRGIFAAGEVRGIGGVEVALLEGRLAGLAAARQLGYKASENGRELSRDLAEWRKTRAAVESLGAMFTCKLGVFAAVEDHVMVCRCEDITAGAIREAVRGGVITLNSLKTWNRCGMGRCQGRICGPIAAHIIAAEAGVSVESAGTFTARTPIKPVPLGIVGMPGSVPAATGPAMEDHVGYGRAVVRKPV
jgi:NADPH-dependent 2,4-dienoyl-CoA reductase/sulfur reductase-like enzyme